MAEEERTKKIIFTDSYKTKDLIWEAYSGYTEHYNNYLMMKTLRNEADPITIAGLTRYANYFYDEIRDFLDDFEKDLKDLNEIKFIFKKEKMENGDFKKVRIFQAQFMKVTGIKNVMKDKFDAGAAVEGAR